MNSHAQRLNWLKQSGWRAATVLDVGAHKGDWAKMLCSVFPEAKILMIEADDRHESDLLATGYPYHLGVVGKLQGVVDFYTQPDPLWSTGASIFKENTPIYDDGSLVKKIPMKRLDQIVKERSLEKINFIKLDVQGAEIDVLEGCSAILREHPVDYVLAEVSLVNANHGAPLADAVISYMRSIGFGMFDIYELHYWKNQLLQLDILFARNHLITSGVLKEMSLPTIITTPPPTAMASSRRLRIGIHSEQFDGRGTGKVPLDYGTAMADILGHEPIFITTKHQANEGLPAIQKRFKTILYESSQPEAVRSNLATIAAKEKLDFLYMVKSGQNDGKTPDNCPTGVHCVFLMNEPHGTIYAGVSEFLARRFGQSLYVPHIIKNFPPTENWRKKFNIPDHALVVGRCGGSMTFNVDFVKQVVKLALEKRPDLYFLFLSTDQFFQHERAIFLPWVETEQEKFNFIHACDIMLHARHGGETFGLAVGEFSVANKPVLTWSGLGDPHSHDKAHIEILGSKAMIYNNPQDLWTYLMGITKDHLRDRSWDMYSERFSSESVIKQFNNVFLSH
ncbi:MAG: FkbM family methyltransferase [Rhodocyclaceae bacterium]|jgi:FkbM family methyltransferase|nr:FkbM family methyltransferase [Rhodocyclaceae bacterium]MBK6909284.1 FkbM family methyltransferase [Rhodocyclaceae bacterium]